MEEKAEMDIKAYLNSSTLAWKSHGQEEPGRLQSMGSLRVGHGWATSLLVFIHWRRKWQPTPVFLPGESQDRGAWWAAIFGVAKSWTRLKWLRGSKLKKEKGTNISLILPFLVIQFCSYLLTLPVVLGIIRM